MKKNNLNVLGIRKIISIILIFLMILSNNSYAYGIGIKQSTRDENLVYQTHPGVVNMARELKKKHPNWRFEYYNTGYDFEEFANVEFDAGNTRSPKNLIESNNGTRYGSEWLDQERIHLGFDSYASRKRWQAPSKEAVRYFLDPRNYLNEEKIFSLMILRGCGDIWDNNTALNFVRKILNGSHQGREQDVVDASKEADVYLLELASKLKQEGGLEGKIDGVTYYNPLNIRANGSSTEEVVRRGLEYAKQNGWDTFKKGLVGGANGTLKRYIQRGQDTKYLMKFDAVTRIPAGYQYMQNIEAAISEGRLLRRGLLTADSNLTGSYIFRIPLYYNMPDEISPRPDLSTNFGSTDRYGIVTVSSILKFRTKPSLASDSVVIGQLNNGLKVEILEGPISAQGHEWYKIRVNGTEGYVSRGAYDDPEKNLEIRNNEEKKPKPTPEDQGFGKTDRYGIVTVNTSLAVRTKPTLGSNSVTITRLQNATKVEILEGPIYADDHEWYKIRVDGIEGYSSRGSVNDSDKNMEIKNNNKKPEKPEKTEENENTGDSEIKPKDNHEYIDNAEEILPCYAVTKGEINLTKDRDSKEFITKIPENVEILILEKENDGNYKISFEGNIGYIKKTQEEKNLFSYIKLNGIPNKEKPKFDKPLQPEKTKIEKSETEGLVFEGKNEGLGRYDDKYIYFDWKIDQKLFALSNYEKISVYDKNDLTKKIELEEDVKILKGEKRNLAETNVIDAKDAKTNEIENISNTVNTDNKNNKENKENKEKTNNLKTNEVEKTILNPTEVKKLDDSKENSNVLKIEEVTEEISNEKEKTQKEEIKKAEKNIIKALSTGNVIEFNGKKYTIIRKGDITFDGKITVDDLKKMIVIINERKQFTEEEKLAAYVQIGFDKKAVEEYTPNIVSVSNMTYAIVELIKIKYGII